MKRSEVPEKFKRFIYEIDGVPYLIRVRKLTPTTCWKLMGFKQEDVENAKKVCSDSQLYKQAGNSIVVQCIENIVKEML